MNGKALWVVLEAKPGKESEVEKFLQAGQGLVEAEPKTVSWFAIKIGPSTYGIFDTFADDSGRDAHLNGKVAQALKEKASELLAKSPSIEKIDVIASKLPKIIAERAERVSNSVVTSSNLICRRLGFGIAVCLCILVFSACEYEVPITPSATQKVQERLLGDWTSADGKEKMKVRKLDDSIYIVYYDGDLFRAYHSDIAETPFASVQDLNSNDRKYAYVVWKLSDDGKHLNLRNVNRKVIPKESRDSATVAALLTKNARNPELFGEAIEFTREK